MSSVLQTPEVSQLLGQNNVHRNLYPPQLIEAALRRGEAELGSRGSLVAETGSRTGRSPKDKFFVRDAATDKTVDWGSINLGTSPAIFDALYERVLDYLAGKELFVQDLYCGADPNYRLPVQFINEYAWHNLFVRQLFIRPTAEELKSHKPEFTIVSAPGVYLMGMQFLRRRKSALIDGAGDDARDLSAHLAAYLANAAPS